MGGTSAANEHYLTGDWRYQYRKWALSERWLEVPVPQMSIIWTVTGGTSTANEHYLTGDWRYQYRKSAHLTGDERHAAYGDDLSAALTQLYQHGLDIAAQLLDTIVFRLCLQNLGICLESRNRSYGMIILCQHP